MNEIFGNKNIAGQIFDRQLLKQHLNRFGKNFAHDDFLFQEVAKNLIEDISYFNQDFPDILEIGSKSDFLRQEISKIKNLENFVQTSLGSGLSHVDIQMDEEFLCFKENSFDLVINNLNLHFINDVLGNLIQTKQILKERGIFICSFFGGETLKELREVFSKVELEIFGGISPRIIPFIDVKSAGMLAQKAGFKNVITDSYLIEISYSKILKLLQDLKNMGLSNILFERGRKPFSKKMLFLMEKLIKETYSSGPQTFKVKFEVITITAFN